MAFSSGTVTVREDATLICLVPYTGVRIRNCGDATVHIGGADVNEDGYPIEPGTSELIQGVKAKETPIVPAPPGDVDDAMLYGCTAAGAGTTQVAYITVDLS
jgi:hypothetical protein